MQYELLRLLGAGASAHHGANSNAFGMDPIHNPIAAATVASYGHAGGGGGGVGGVGGGVGVGVGAGGADPRAVQVFCAGDDDQSVYAWRGVHAVENMRRFASEFPGASVLHLDRSYRLPTHVLGTATAPQFHSPNLPITHIRNPYPILSYRYLKPPSDSC